jgi:hypothetical protein
MWQMRNVIGPFYPLVLERVAKIVNISGDMYLLSLDYSKQNKQ